MPRSKRDVLLRNNVSQDMDVGIGWRQPHYKPLLEQLPALDFLEVHSENFFSRGGAALKLLDRGRAHYPVSLHGVALSLGSAAGLDPWHLEQLAALVKHIDPVRVSDHASFARGVYKGKLVHASDLLPIPFTHESLNLMCQHVDQVQERLQRPFMVENLSAYIAWEASSTEAVLQETDFLMALTQRTGCSLLIDVNNIYVNALNACKFLADDGQAQDPEAVCCAWLDAIDPECVGEMHLAGHCHVNDEHGDIVIDDHGSQVCEAVWRLYGHAVQRFGALPTLIEWDTEIPTLDVLLGEADRARSMVAGLQAQALA